MGGNSDSEKLAGPELEELIQKIAEAEKNLEAFLGPGVDAVLDPIRSAPVFLPQADQALRQSESRYRRLLENLSALVLEMDPGGTIEWVNEAACTLTGQDRESLTGRNWRALFVPLSDRGALEELHDRWATGDVRGVEIPFRINGSPPLVLELHSANRYAEDGALERIVLLGTDITARRNAQAAQEKAHAELQAVLASMADGVIVYSIEGKIVQMNRAAREMFGFSEAEFRLTPLERMEEVRAENGEGNGVEPQDLPVMKALRGETVRGRVISYIRHDRPPQHLSVSAAPLRTRDGELRGAVATFTDISEIRELQKQQEMYVHTISHDLRSPLTVISGHAQLLQVALGSGKICSVAGNVRGILQASERMEEMIQDLAEAARLGGGELRLQVQPVRLDEFLERFRIAREGGMKMDRVHFQIPENLPPLSADPSRLERVFNNLIGNALKYSSPPSAVVVQAARVAGGVEISVRDSGEGIPAEDLPHIFQQFYRPSRNTRPDSIGLGLYITRMLVLAHGGEIRAESTVGEGSVFRFTLPIDTSGT